MVNIYTEMAAILYLLLSESLKFSRQKIGKLLFEHVTGAPSAELKIWRNKWGLYIPEYGKQKPDSECYRVIDSVHNWDTGKKNMIPHDFSEFIS